jgi:fructan beta-fructosidase
VGAHGGVWECPDLFPLTYQGEKIWVLLVSINPGGPNKGSATQYFTGKV